MNSIFSIRRVNPSAFSTKIIINIIIIIIIIVIIIITVFINVIFIILIVHFYYIKNIFNKI